jgi:hypothetical protein
MRNDYPPIIPAVWLLFALGSSGSPRLVFFGMITVLLHGWAPIRLAVLARFGRAGYLGALRGSLGSRILHLNYRVACLNRLS